MTNTPVRCAVRWTPEPVDGVCYPEVQCTHRDDVEHRHYWSLSEAELWEKVDLSR